MPLFFIIGAILINKFQIELKRGFFLFLIYLFWVIIYSKFDLNYILKGLLVANYNSIKSVLWFIPAIITFKLMYSLSEKVNYLKYIFILLGIVVIVNNQDIQKIHKYVPWGIDIAFYMYPLSLISNLLYKKINNAENLEFKNYFKIINILLFFTILLIFYIRIPINVVTPWHHRLDLAQFTVPGIEGYLYLCILTACVLIFLKENWESKFLSYLGKRSLTVYILHVPIIYLIDYYSEKYFKINILFIIILTILISLLIEDWSKNYIKHSKYIGLY